MQSNKLVLSADTLEATKGFPRSTGTSSYPLPPPVSPTLPLQKPELIIRI